MNNTRRNSIKSQNNLTVKDDDLKQELDTVKALLRKQDRSNRLQDYINQPNVKNFNMLLLDRSFSKIGERNICDTMPIFSNVEYAKNEIVEYFKTCNEYHMTPHVGSLCSFLGIRRNELVYYSSHPEICPTALVLAEALDYCQYILEENVINDKLDPRTYAYMGANYFRMMTNSTVVDFKPTFDNQGFTNSESLTVLREQLTNTSKNIDKDVVK